MNTRSKTIGLAEKARAKTEESTHEEDRRADAEGREYGAAHWEEFVAEHRAELDALILIYEDGEAEELFNVLREKFWARTWTPRSQKPGEVG